MTGGTAHCIYGVVHVNQAPFLDLAAGLIGEKIREGARSVGLEINPRQLRERRFPTFFKVLAGQLEHRGVRIVPLVRDSTSEKAAIMLTAMNEGLSEQGGYDPNRLRHQAGLVRSDRWKRARSDWPHLPSMFKSLMTNFEVVAAYEKAGELLETLHGDPAKFFEKYREEVVEGVTRDIIGTLTRDPADFALVGASHLDGLTDLAGYRVEDLSRMVQACEERVPSFEGFPLLSEAFNKYARESTIVGALCVYEILHSMVADHGVCREPQAVLEAALRIEPDLMAMMAWGLFQENGPGRYLAPASHPDIIRKPVREAQERVGSVLTEAERV